jgi:predicted choloylglycine hydrolase
VNVTTYLTSGLALLVFWAGSAPAGAPFRFPTGKNGKAELKYVDGVPVLVVTGTPEEIGTGVGALALKPGRRVLGYPRELLGLADLQKLWGVLLGTGKGMYRNFPAEYRRELEAIVASASVDHDLVVAGNTFFDIKKSLACSAVLVEKDKSTTGGTLLARNLDYPSLGYIHHYSLVTVYRPARRLSFAAVGFPGLVGVLSGMNEAGLALAVLEVFEIKVGETHFDARGVPYGLCLRRVLEQARTVDEAKKVLEGLRRTTTINVAVADRHQVAVLEVSPQRVVKRPAMRGVCVTTNHFCSKELKPDRPVNVDDTLERFAKLEEVRGTAGKVGVEELRKQLDRVNLGEVTLQTMCFEPCTLRLYLSIGKVPASRQRMQTIELGALLRPDAIREVGRR